MPSKVLKRPCKGGRGGRGKRGGKILEEALLGVLEGLLSHIKAKFLVMSASSGAHSQNRTLTFFIRRLRALVGPLGPWALVPLLRLY